MEAAGSRCTDCGAARDRLSGEICLRCGWDSQVRMRKCIACKGAVILNEKIGFGPIGGVVGLGGFVFWRLYGPLLGSAPVSSIGTVCGAITARTLGCSCAECGRKSEARFLDSEEKDTARRHRLGFTLSAAGLGALAAVLLFCRLALLRSSSSSV